MTMRISLAGLKKYFLEPPALDFAFGLSRTRLAGVRYSRREKRIAAHVILPFAAGGLEPSFDGKNVRDPAALERTLREAKSRLGPDGSPVALLVPESCVRLHLLTFDALPASPAERDEVVRWRLGKLIPFKPDEMRLTYTILKANGQTRVVAALAREDVIREYEQLFGRLGFDVRMVGVPGLYLPGLIRRDADGLTLVVNLDDDYVSLIAVLGEDIVLYRMKPFHGPAGTAPAPGESAGPILHEVETTIRVLEDRERKKIDAIWVRAVDEAGEALVNSFKDKRPSLRLGTFSVPLAATVRDQNILAPLIGQMLK
jgi:hypothetical protein